MRMKLQLQPFKTNFGALILPSEAAGGALLLGGGLPETVQQ